MPLPSTRQTNVPPFMGKMPTLNDDGQIKEMPFKVNTATKIVSYTVKASESGTFFNNRGTTATVVFTLPAMASGLNYHFYAAADRALTVTSGTADKMIADNDVEADSLSLSTGSEIMGGCIVVTCDGTKWMANAYLEESQTAVVAT
ncbi:MAG: hypothetical protein KAH01_00295 [Caldisericia bacterium]|nr:hypothetical protein [Caldisericia bacterium]